MHSVERENNKKCNFISNLNSEVFIKTISKLNLTINISQCWF
jgi:hypothetical protein